MKPTKFKNLVYLDVETYFDREYSLSKMTMTEYIRDPRFKLHSIQMAINDGEIQYFDTDHIEDALVLLRSLDNWALVAQNTAFDAAILNWRYGIKPSLLRYHVNEPWVLAHRIRFTQRTRDSCIP